MKIITNSTDFLSLTVGDKGTFVIGGKIDCNNGYVERQAKSSFSAKWKSFDKSGNFVTQSDDLGTAIKAIN